MSDETQTTDTQSVKRKAAARKRKSPARRSTDRKPQRRRKECEIKAEKASGKPLIGRPPKVIDGDRVEELAARGWPQAAIAHTVGCSVDTLTRRFADRLRAGTLRMQGIVADQQYIALTTPGDKARPQMLRWLGIQHLGQREKSEVTGADGGPLQRQVSITLELPEQVKRMVQLMQAAGASEEQIRAILPADLRALPSATPQQVVVDADFEDVPRQQIDN